MKTIEITLYKFAELSATAQEKALTNLSTINVDYEWYDSVYDDAKQIGLKITSFDIDRGAYCKGEFTQSACEVANAISVNHGETCGTYKSAEQFLEEWTKLVAHYSDGINTEKVAEGNEQDFDTAADELEREFFTEILEEYRLLLSREYDYLTSKAAIIETIEANDYDFTEEGELY